MEEVLAVGAQQPCRIAGITAGRRAFRRRGWYVRGETNALPVVVFDTGLHIGKAIKMRITGGKLDYGERKTVFRASGAARAPRIENGKSVGVKRGGHITKTLFELSYLPAKCRVFVCFVWRRVQYLNLVFVFVTVILILFLS